MERFLWKADFSRQPLKLDVPGGADAVAGRCPEPCFSLPQLLVLQTAWGRERMDHSLWKKRSPFPPSVNLPKSSIFPSSFPCKTVFSPFSRSLSVYQGGFLSPLLPRGHAAILASSGPHLPDSATLNNPRPSGLTGRSQAFLFPGWDGFFIPAVNVMLTSPPPKAQPKGEESSRFGSV